MDKREIKSLIEAEKAEFHLFLKLSKKLHLSEEEIEKQTDFYLDKLNELKEKLKNSSSE